MCYFARNLGAPLVVSLAVLNDMRREACECALNNPEEQ